MITIIFFHGLLISPLKVIKWSVLIRSYHSLHSVIEDIAVNECGKRNTENLRLQLSHKQVWMASSIHRGEEES